MEGAEISVGKTLAVTVEKGKRMPTLTKKFKVKINEKLCKGCFFCIEFCPKKSIFLSTKLNMKGYFVADFTPENDCTGCATCAIVCPEVAIEVYKA